MSLLKRFTDYILEKNLFQSRDHLLVAVSGGVDSVVLTDLCYKAGYKFSIAHCNFQLRDEESERDEELVRSLSEKYKVDFFIKKFTTKDYAAAQKVSVQVAARELRYQWFEELMKQADNRQPTTGDRQLAKDNQLAYLLTAHHADDNIETVLMNFLKGTGIKGLHGILPKQNKIIRPLLFAKKEELLLYAKENDLIYAEDSSNSTDKYTRNYFRNQLIPSLEKVFPQVQDNLIHNVERFKEIETLYRQIIQIHKKRLLEYKGNEVHIPVLKLQKSKPLQTIIYEIINEYNFTPHQAQDVLHLLISESGRYVSSPTHTIFKNRKWLIITPKKTTEAATILIHENDTKIEFENGIIYIKRYINDGSKPAAASTSATLDYSKISFPLLLRKWKSGDYFYPLGMQNLPAGGGGKKKLSKFFIDKKIAVTDKEKIWVIESNRKIIWIINMRIDDRFKITDQTKNILFIDFKEL